MSSEEQSLEQEERFTFQLDRFKDGQPVETVQKILGGGIGHTWPDLIQDFLDFLRGCGFKIEDVMPVSVKEVMVTEVAEEEESPKPTRRRRRKK